MGEIDNPQLKIDNRPAWRLYNRMGEFSVEPFFGEPRVGEVAVTNMGMWVFTHDDWQYTTLHAQADMVVAWLRFFLAHKQGVDNQRQKTTERINKLKDALDDAIEFMKTVRLHSRDYAAEMPNLDSEIIRLTEIMEEE